MSLAPKIDEVNNIVTNANFDVVCITETWGAYNLTEKSGWSVESIMVSDLPVYHRNTTSVTL